MDNDELLDKMYRMVIDGITKNFWEGKWFDKRERRRNEFDGIIPPFEYAGRNY